MNCSWDILRDSRAVSWFERKCATKVFKHGQKSSAWVLTLTHFQKVKRMLTPDWAQNMICIILPNRQTASSEFFSSIRTRGLWSSHTCPFRSPKLNMQGKIIFSTFLTKYEGTTDDSRKRFGCYQQDHYNLHRENSVSDKSQGIVNTIYKGVTDESLNTC